LEQKLAHLDPEYYSDIGFACFERYFRIANGEVRNIDKAEDPKQFTVLSFSLLGLDTLWKLVLSAKNSVAGTAITCLNSLFEKVLIFWSDFSIHSYRDCKIFPICTKNTSLPFLQNCKRHKARIL
jgi:hypothetical protein